MAKPRKPIVRAKTGLRGVPTTSFRNMKYYFHTDLDKKQVSDVIKSYVKSNFPKRDVDMILANPEYQFTMFSHLAAAAYWITLKLPIDEEIVEFQEGLTRHLLELKEKGKDILSTRKQQEKAAKNVIIFQPRDKILQKLDFTVFEDLYKLEDDWHAGVQSSYDMFTAFKIHGLPTSAISHVLPVVKRHYDEYAEVYAKEDKQLVEAYSHLSRKVVKHRMDQYKKMLDDLDRLKATVKATRLPRAKKPKALDKQVAKVQYKKEDNEFKLVSINPVKIVGAFRLYVFNTKYKSLTELVTEDVNGFEISGTSIKNFSVELSRSVKLRKPDEFLKVVMNKTPKQIDAEWSKLTTKTGAANGRLNADTILLKAIAK